MTKQEDNEICGNCEYSKGTHNNKNTFRRKFMESVTGKICKKFTPQNKIIAKTQKEQDNRKRICPKCKSSDINFGKFLGTCFNCNYTDDKREFQKINKMNTDTINNIKAQAEKIKEIVRLQEIKEKGLSNNRQTREQADLKLKPTAEEIIKELE